MYGLCVFFFIFSGDCLSYPEATIELKKDINKYPLNDGFPFDIEVNNTYCDSDRICSRGEYCVNNGNSSTMLCKGCPGLSDTSECNGHGTCNKVTDNTTHIYCKCSDGWRYDDCSMCDTGYYGEDCRECPGLIEPSIACKYIYNNY